MPANSKKIIALVLLLPLALSISFAVIAYLDTPISIRRAIAFVLAAIAASILLTILLLVLSRRSTGQEVSAEQQIQQLKKHQQALEQGIKELMRNRSDLFSRLQETANKNFQLNDALQKLEHAKNVLEDRIKNMNTLLTEREEMAEYWKEQTRLAVQENASLREQLEKLQQRQQSEQRQR